LTAARRAQCVDSSVAIAAFGEWHELHSTALGALASSPALVAHAGLAAYSVLTRLPQPFRAPAATVADYLARNFTGKRLALPAAAQRALPEDRIGPAGLRRALPERPEQGLGDAGEPRVGDRAPVATAPAWRARHHLTRW